MPVSDQNSSSVGYMTLTEKQRDTLEYVERFGASLSLVGVFSIFITFYCFRRLRTVPNTFILFASIANVGASTACLIGYEGIKAGDESALCQTQAFLLELFMQSDPWWSLAMAINVFMVFFCSANPSAFRARIWFYVAACFGIPLMPAIILLLYKPGRDVIYGDATLWCWIGDSHNSLRIYTYYIPIWACILLSAVIYFAVGCHVFRQRNQLRNLTLSNQAKRATLEDRVDAMDWGSSADLERDSADKTCVHQPGRCTVTTEFRVTAESSGPSPPLTASDLVASLAPVSPVSPRSHAPDRRWCVPVEEFDLTDESGDNVEPSDGRTALDRRDALARYTGFSPANYSSVCTRSEERARIGNQGPLQRTLERMLDKLRHMDSIKLAYLRTSFVFAISVLVTWIPSSINRVYSLNNRAGTSYSLNMASAVVLPLQGVWNTIIYCATSWRALRDEFRRLRGHKMWDRWIAEPSPCDGRRRRIRLTIDENHRLATAPPRRAQLRVARDGFF